MDLIEQGNGQWIIFLPLLEKPQRMLTYTCIFLNLNLSVTENKHIYIYISEDLRIKHCKWRRINVQWCRCQFGQLLPTPSENRGKKKFVKRAPRDYDPINPTRLALPPPRPRHWLAVHYETPVPEATARREMWQIPRTEPETRSAGSEGRPGHSWRHPSSGAIASCPWLFIGSLNATQLRCLSSPNVRVCLIN